MNNSKKNVHVSGPLGMLMKSGQVKPIDFSQLTATPKQSEEKKPEPAYYKTTSGIEFHEQELMHVDPQECEPWKYANRLEDEMKGIDELIESIRQNKQLQPALVRVHPEPHDNIKYEIIFGRRRHQACLQLGVPFLVIKKDIKSIQDAVALQDAENKLREDVSNYSNAILYKRLLNDKIFPTELALAEKLGLASSSLNDLLAYAKIPSEIVAAIPDIHSLSKRMASKIVHILNRFPHKHGSILSLAPSVGVTITSPVALEKAVESFGLPKSPSLRTATIVKSKEGVKLFTLKDEKGAYSLVINKKLNDKISIEKLSAQFKAALEKAISESVETEDLTA